MSIAEQKMRQDSKQETEGKGWGGGSAGGG